MVRGVQGQLMILRLKQNKNPEVYGDYFEMLQHHISMLNQIVFKNPKTRTVSIPKNIVEEIEATISYLGFEFYD